MWMLMSKGALIDLFSFQTVRPRLLCVHVEFVDDSCWVIVRFHYDCFSVPHQCCEVLCFSDCCRYLTTANQSMADICLNDMI